MVSASEHYQSSAGAHCRSGRRMTIARDTKQSYRTSLALRDQLQGLCIQPSVVHDCRGVLSKLGGISKSPSPQYTTRPPIPDDRLNQDFTSHACSESAASIRFLSTAADGDTEVPQGSSAPEEQEGRCEAQRGLRLESTFVKAVPTMPKDDGQSARRHTRGTPRCNGHPSYSSERSGKARSRSDSCVYSPTPREARNMLYVFVETLLKGTC